MRFGSKKVTDENGVIWDSTTEYKYGLKLKELQEKGVIKDLQRQVPYLLIPAFKDGQGNSVRKTEYVADFVYTDVATGHTIIADSKGSEFNIDPVFKLKFKMLKEKFKDKKDIEFQIIIKYKDVWYNLENKEEKKRYKEIYKNRKKKTKK